MKSPRFFLTILIALIPFSSQVLSQPVSPGGLADSVTLDAIQIRGTKEGKTYLEETSSVRVLQENEVPGNGRENNLQILNAVPNVEVNKDGTSFSIRGINNTGVNGFQTDNLSSILIDDLFQTDLAIQSGSFDLWDLDRIEILRGAQSTTQGVNSLAGTILLNHKRPVFGREGSAKLGLGNFWHQEAGVVANHDLIDEKLAIRLSIDKERNDGFITNSTTGNRKYGGWDRERLNAGLTYKLNSYDSLGLLLKYNRNVQGGTYVHGGDYYQDRVTEDQENVTQTENGQVVATYSKLLTPQLSNDLIIGFSKTNQDSNSDGDNTPVNVAGTRLETHADHFVSVENRLLYKGERVDNLFGFHAHDFNLKDSTDVGLLTSSAGPAIPSKQFTDRSRRTYALFDTATIHLSDRHGLITGLRVEYVQTSYEADIYAPTIPGATGAYGGRRDGFTLLPKIGYTFQNGQHYAGATYTRGYRTAGVSINRARAAAVEYDPEFTSNYEISYKFANPVYEFASNVFYTDWREQQVLVQLPGNQFDTQIQNAASSELYGAEVESKFKGVARQVYALGVGYTDTRFKDFQTRTANLAGNQFPFASHWTSRISHDFKATENLGLLTVLRYVSGGYSNAENTREIDPQFYLNFNARYALADWLLEGYVNNALDNRARLFDGTPTSTTYPPLHRVNTPREFGGRVTYSF
jgi:iron complex outermembrane receptor protein